MLCLVWNTRSMVKNTKRFSRLKPLSVLLKKRRNCRVSRLLRSRLKVMQLPMTTPKKHGLPATNTKPSPWVSPSLKKRWKTTCMTACRLVIPKVWLVLWRTPSKLRQLQSLTTRLLVARPTVTVLSCVPLLIRWFLAARTATLAALLT